MVLRALRVFVFVVSAFAVTALTLVGSRVVTQPRALDSVEVSLLVSAERAASGGALYVEPSHADEPALMPGFPLAVSLMARGFGPDLRQGRALALLATLLVAALALFIVRLETRSWTLAVASVGFVILGCGLLAGPPAAARPEILMMLLVMLGFLALRLTNGMLGALAAALLLAAAFFTSAAAVWFVPAAVLALAFEERKRLVTLAVASTVLIGGGYVALSQVFGPWFNFMVWDEWMRALRLSASAPLRYVGDHLLGRLGVPTLATVLSFAMPTPPWRGKPGLWTCMAIAAVAGGLLSTQNGAFGPEARLPGIIALAILGPISMQRVTQHLSAWPGSSRLGGQGVVLAALTLQFIVFLSCLSSSSWRTGAEHRMSLAPSPAVSAPSRLAHAGSETAMNDERGGAGLVRDPGVRTASVR